MNGITVLIPKTIFDDIGNFQVDLKYTQDYDLWMKIQEKYPFVHMEDILSITRFHPGQESKSIGAIPECNRLWISMVESLSDIEKMQYEGSLYRFYFEMARFLRPTPYDGALKYCEKKQEDIRARIYRGKNLDEMSSDILDFIDIRDKENLEKIADLESDIMANNAIIISLKAENNNLSSTLDAVYNSKRYKIIDKIANAKNRISR